MSGRAVAIAGDSSSSSAARHLHQGGGSSSSPADSIQVQPGSHTRGGDSSRQWANGRPAAAASTQGSAAGAGASNEARTRHCVAVKVCYLIKSNACGC